MAMEDSDGPDGHTPGEMTSNILRIATEARALTLGPFSPSFKVNQIVKEGLEKLLPNDIHTLVSLPLHSLHSNLIILSKVSGRLNVSVTKVYDGKNMLINQFSSKAEVILL